MTDYGYVATLKNFKITVTHTFLLYLILYLSLISKFLVTNSHLLLLLIGLTVFLHPRCFCLALPFTMQESFYSTRMLDNTPWNLPSECMPYCLQKFFRNADVVSNQLSQMSGLDRGISCESYYFISFLIIANNMKT